MHDHDPTLRVRNTILVALGLTASAFAGAGGCADRSSHAVCVDTEADYATCDQLAPIEEPSPDAPEVRIEEVCFPSADGCDPCDAEAITGAALEYTDARCTSVELESVTLLCGPDPDPAVEDCCYKVALVGAFSCPVSGRPLLAGVEPTPRVAPLRAGRAWLADVDDLEALRRPREPAALAALRDYWLACGRYEHASVASFARVCLQLASLGAPPALIACRMFDSWKMKLPALRAASGAPSALHKPSLVSGM